MNREIEQEYLQKVTGFAGYSRKISAFFINTTSRDFMW